MTACDDSKPNFEGHEPRRCGEHRTVGSHRAWCYTCTSWCYPSDGCAGCKPDVDDLMEENDRLRAVADAAQAIYHQHHTDEALLPEDLEWGVLGAALKAWEAISDD